MRQALESTIGTSELDHLRSTFRGPIVAIDDPAYDDVRRIWNAAVERRPAAFARCTGSADVITALQFARAHDLEVAVRGGGHNVAGTALCDGGLVIDLQLMKGIRVDPSARSLVAQPGLRLGDVDHETQAFGLAAVSGINSETGLAGLTLGGGIGWQMRKHGLSVDQLLEADVVTAEGKLLRASENENAELYWAIRGGGGNFGIVTAFKFKLVELGPQVYGGVVLYPAERAREVLRAYRNWAADAPDEVTTILLFRLAPPFPWVPDDIRGRPVLGLGGLYTGSATDAVTPMAPLSSFGPVLASSMQARSFVSQQSMLDASAPPGRLYYWKSHYMAGLTDAAIEVIADNAWRFKSPYSFTLLSHMGGAIRGVSDEDTAFSGRGSEFTININCCANERSQYESDREWVREWFDALAPHSTGGVYVNFMGQEGPDRVLAAYGEAKFRRLAELKAKFDPDNVFKTNQNIAPRR
jgi:FAD/FMN-containing dehydrogenase